MKGRVKRITLSIASVAVLVVASLVAILWFSVKTEFFGIDPRSTYLFRFFFDTN